MQSLENTPVDPSNFVLKVLHLDIMPGTSIHFAIHTALHILVSTTIEKVVFVFNGTTVKVKFGDSVKSVYEQYEGSRRNDG